MGGGGGKGDMIRKQICGQRIDDDSQATWDVIGWNTRIRQL